MPLSAAAIPRKMRALIGGGLRPDSAGDPTSAMGEWQADQSSPPSHVSRFQMGTVAFRVSMQ